MVPPDKRLGYGNYLYSDDNGNSIWNFIGGVATIFTSKILPDIFGNLTPECKLWQKAADYWFRIIDLPALEVHIMDHICLKVITYK